MTGNLFYWKRQRNKWQSPWPITRTGRWFTKTCRPDGDPHCDLCYHRTTDEEKSDFLKDDTDFENLCIFTRDNKSRFTKGTVTIGWSLVQTSGGLPE